MRRGFLLLETIVVISVLSIILIALYVGYNNTINRVKAQLKYDNTEYIYKTYILKTYMEKNIVNEGSYACSNCESVYIFCSDLNSSQVTSCQSDNASTTSKDAFLQDMIDKMKVMAIYITKWDTSTFLDKPEIMNTFEVTTQRYIKALNPTKKDVYRIIVMYEDENDQASIQYASLEFESKIRGVDINE